MSRILHIAGREWRELGRQPWMLASVGSLFLVIALLTTSAVALLSLISSNPQMLHTLEAMLPFPGLDAEIFIEDAAQAVVNTANFLMFTQLLGITAVLAGHTVLHDRQCGTLPFLLLSPISRVELLTGKILGALGIPLVFYIVFDLLSAVAMRLCPITTNLPPILPPSPAWIMAFLISGPLWAAVVCTLCAIVSSLARDVRTAQQVVWFLMFFASTILGYLLSTLIAYGVVVQLIIAGAAILMLGTALFVGAVVMSRDLSR